MGDIRLIDRSTDLTNVKIREYPWDVEISGCPFKIVDVEGYVHTIGGMYGHNSYWVCPRDEEPSGKNLIEWNGCIGGCCWGVDMRPKHYTKTKWGETEVLTTSGAMITRNGKDFLYVHGPIELALATLIRIKEHPISFGNWDWREQINGRKIYYRSEPAKVSRLIAYDNGYLEMIIEPDGGLERFSMPPEFSKGIGGKRGEREIKVDVLDSNVYWFRD